MLYASEVVTDASQGRIGLWHPVGQAQQCQVPDDLSCRTASHAGSTAAGTDGRIAVTLAHGGVRMVHVENGTHHAIHARADISGMAAQGLEQRAVFLPLTTPECFGTVTRPG